MGQILTTCERAPIYIMEGCDVRANLGMLMDAINENDDANMLYDELDNLGLELPRHGFFEYDPENLTPYTTVCTEDMIRGLRTAIREEMELFAWDLLDSFRRAKNSEELIVELGALGCNFAQHYCDMIRPDGTPLDL